MLAFIGMYEQGCSMLLFAMIFEDFTSWSWEAGIYDATCILSQLFAHLFGTYSNETMSMSEIVMR